MKIVQVNATCGVGSTGKICTAISSILNLNRIDNYILYSSGKSDYCSGIRYMSDIEIKLGALESRLLGNYGFNSSFATRRMIRLLEEIGPDIVHIHNVHTHNCNIELLINYLIEKKIKIVWTFHDCWAFTGCCTYFSLIGCEKWKTQCKTCPKISDFSWFIDTSKRLFAQKKKLLEKADLTIVTPSVWLANLVRESFLGNSTIEVINNGIDINTFKPRDSSFRSRNGISDKEKMILGVSFEWGMRKGLDLFAEMARELPKHYRIVLVGTNEQIDKTLPANIITVHKTDNQNQLAEIYSAADIFVNPTREDNYPTVNMEALSCGTPVVTFDTGGSAEMIDETCGMIVKQNDLRGLVDSIIRITESKLYTEEACLRKANEFNQSICFSKYLEVYKRLENEQSN